MSDDELLNRILRFAERAHGTQVRKYTGERYINHPIRVMETVRRFSPNFSVLAAALLHDVLEDTSVSVDEIRGELLKLVPMPQAQRTLELVIELTDVFVKKSFPEMNRRARKQKEFERLAKVSADAQTIKYADVIDNVTDIARQDTDFANTYIKEARQMLKGMDKGDPRLRADAVSTVNRVLKVST